MILASPKLLINLLSSMISKDSHKATQKKITPNKDSSIFTIFADPSVSPSYVNEIVSNVIINPSGKLTCFVNEKPTDPKAKIKIINNPRIIILLLLSKPPSFFLNICNYSINSIYKDFH